HGGNAVLAAGYMLDGSDFNFALARFQTTGAPSARQVPSDANGDGKLDISDAVWLLGFLFLGTSVAAPCDGGAALGAGSVNVLDGNGDGKVDITDPVYVLGFLFAGGAPPVLGQACTAVEGCPAACGP